MRGPERLTLAFVRAAAARGAAVANYCRMDRVLSEGGRVRGVMVTDLEGGGAFEVRGHSVVVAAGPWTPELVAPGQARAHAFALNLEISRRLAETAVGVRATSGPADDPIIGGHRFIFLVPQGETTLLGTWYAPADGTAPRATADTRGRRPCWRNSGRPAPRCNSRPRMWSAASGAGSRSRTDASRGGATLWPSALV